MKQLFLLLLVSVFLCAEVKTYTKTVRQSFGGAQTPDDARLSAIKKAEADISREAGEYISTRTVLENNQMTDDQIVAISAAILKTVVLSEKPFVEGSSYGLEITVSSTLDLDTIDAQIEKILASQENLATIESLKTQNDALRQKLQALEAQNAQAQSEQEKAEVKAEYRVAQDQAKAIEFFDAGNKAFLAEDYEQAIADYTQAIKLDPNYATAYYNRGNSYAELGDYSKAIADFTQAIKLDPNDAKAYYNRGFSYVKLGDRSKAIADYTQAIKLDPNYAEAYNNRGISYAELGDYSKAIADFTQAIKLDPSYAEAYYNRGNSYAELGDDSKAIADYTQAIKLDPNFAIAYFNRGISYANLGDLYSATRDARKACELGNCSLLKVMGEKGLIRE